MFPQPDPEELCHQCEQPWKSHRLTEYGHCPAVRIKVKQTTGYTEIQFEPLPYQLRPAVLRKAQAAKATRRK